MAHKLNLRHVVVLKPILQNPDVSRQPGTKNKIIEKSIRSVVKAGMPAEALAKAGGRRGSRARMRDFTVFKILRRLNYLA